MIYYSDDLIEQWILDDVNQGDLTTRILGFGEKAGTITFSLKNAGRVSGISASEKKIIVEADNLEEALTALKAEPDVLQLDKFSPDDVRRIADRAASDYPDCLISAAAGAGLLVSSSPYYAPPADVKVVMSGSSV
jgi:nicotinate-nucleotide pyrophosphorylase